MFVRMSSPMTVYARINKRGTPDKVVFMPVGMAYASSTGRGLNIELTCPVGVTEFVIRSGYYEFEE